VSETLKSYIDDEGLFHKASGRDGGQLFREAVYWWRFQLEKIEEEIERALTKI
jgi:hypothetical protein